MRTVRDPNCVLSEGLAAIRTQFQLPSTFPPAAEMEAREAAQRDIGDRTDRTSVPFVTLDPAESRDLDQAFSIEPAAGDLDGIQRGGVFGDGRLGVLRLRGVRGGREGGGNGCRADA